MYILNLQLQVPLFELEDNVIFSDKVLRGIIFI